MTNAGVEPDTYGELVARLRKRDEGYFDEADQSFGTRLDPDCQEAATAIETLERERDGLREANEHANRMQRLTMDKRQAAEAEVGEITALILMADRFCLGKTPLNETVWVVSRGLSTWAIWNGTSVFNTDGEWEWEPLASGRDAAFFARTRYTFADALTRARTALKDKP